MQTLAQIDLADEEDHAHDGPVRPLHLGCDYHNLVRSGMAGDEGEG